MRKRPATIPKAVTNCSCKRAVEAGDQKEMNALFARRSRRQMIRLAVGLLAGHGGDPAGGVAVAVAAAAGGSARAAKPNLPAAPPARR